MPQANHSWVKLVVLTSPHGVKGALKAKSFTDPAKAFADYTLSDESGKSVSLKIIGGTADAPIVQVEGVTSREVAELWRNKTLGVAREQLKEIHKDDTHYIADLIDMKIADAQGAELGKVVNVMNFGAGDILEIAFTKGNVDMFAFTKKTFPKIDKQAQCITMNPPELLGSRTEEGEDQGDNDAA